MSATIDTGTIRRAGFPVGLLTMVLLSLAAWPAFANDDQGDSSVVITRICNTCRDGSACPTSGWDKGFCPDGIPCASYVCSDGTTCGAGGPGLCGDGVTRCVETRFGSRCSSTGFGDKCDPEAACRIDSVYLTDRAQCIYALNPREPYCWDSSAGEFTRSSWSECGMGDPGDPTGESDECSSGTSCSAGMCGEGGPGLCADLTPCTSSCQYCRGIPTACPTGQGPCGAGGPGLCADGLTSCLTQACSDGSVCGEGGVGLCDNGDACDCVTSVCKGGSCGDGGEGLCADKTPCFRPKMDRVFSRYATDKPIIGTPTLMTCDPDPVQFQDAANWAGETRSPAGTTGLNPRPVGNDCVAIGTLTGYMFMIDEESRNFTDECFDGSVCGSGGTGLCADLQPCGVLQAHPPGACLWRMDTVGEIQSAAVADPFEDFLYIGNTGESGGFDLYRYLRAPIVDTPGTCNPSLPSGPTTPFDPVACATAIEPDDPNTNWPFADATIKEIKGDGLIPHVAGDPSTPIVDRLVIGSKKGMRLIRLGDDPEVEPMVGENSQQYRRSIVQASDGVFYSARGESASNGGLVAFIYDADYNGGKGRLTAITDPTNNPTASSLIDKTSPDLFPAGPPAGGDCSVAPTSLLRQCACDGQPGGSNPRIKMSNLQWHRTTPVLNEDETFFFVGNRQAEGNSDLRERITAYPTIDPLDPMPAHPLLVSDDLVNCYHVTGAGITAALAYARVTCDGESNCCGLTKGEKVDRLFFGDKENTFHAINFCEPDPVFGPNEYHFEQVWTKTGLTTFRAQAAVALDRETVYAYDQNGVARLYAFDAHDGTLLWEYWIDDPAYDHSSGVCNPTPGGAGGGGGGRNCYPSGVPLVIDVDLTRCDQAGDECTEHLGVERCCPSGVCAGTEPLCDTVLYPVGGDGTFDEDQVLLAVGVHGFDETGVLPPYVSQVTPPMMGTGIDTGAPIMMSRASSGTVEAVNLTTGVSQVWPCAYICGGVVDLAMGTNEILITAFDRRGKPARSRITINRTL